MSLIVLNKVVTNDSYNIPENANWTTRIETYLALIKINYYSHWKNLSVFAALTDVSNASKNTSRFGNLRKYDDWGRILRTQLWG